MAKFFTAALVAAVASVASVSAADKPACQALSYVENAADIASLNTVIDIALSGNLLASYIPDPITVANNRLDAVDFSVLGTDFTLTTIVDSVNVTGLKNIVPLHLNVTGATTLDIGAYIKGALAVNGTLTFEVAQVDHKWWQICWTDILHPAKCSPISITVDVGAGIQDPSIYTNANVSMVKCGTAAAAAGTCTDFTVTDILLGALTGDFTSLLNRILRRVSSASLTSLSFDFSAFNYINFHFHSSGSLITEIGKKLFEFTTTEINKKGDLYKTLISLVNKLGKTLINQLITQNLGSLFGNTCYDS